MKKKRQNRRRPVAIGVISAIGILSVYIITLTIGNSFTHALEKFAGMWYLILPLVAGFGIQVGLYSYIRMSMHEASKTATAEVAATGGISTTSMIACCSHHLTNLLPIIGFSAAAVFLSKYQVSFLVLGILSNLAGIMMMLNIIQKNGFYSKKSFSFMNRYDLELLRNLTVVVSIILVMTSFFSTAVSVNTVPGLIDDKDKALDKQGLPTMTNDENKVTVEVKPVGFSFDDELKFDIAITTHEGSLDFDLAEISVLEDSNGNEYAPLRWDGAPPGGHHRSGILTFPGLKGETEYLRLTIKNVYNVPERIFVWNIGV